MFITAVCVIFLIKLRWPKNKSFYKLLYFRFVLAKCPKFVQSEVKKRPKTNLQVKYFHHFLTHFVSHGYRN